MIPSIYRMAIFTSICVVVACDARSDDAQVRVGLIDTISGVELHEEYLREFQSRLIATDASGSHGRNSIALFACAAELVSIENQTLQGACGRHVKLPTKWAVDKRSRLYRGVAIGNERPGFKERKKLKFPMPAGRAATQVYEIPNDVILLVNDNGDWNVACDWDCDLNIGKDEEFLIPYDRLAEPNLFQRKIGTGRVQSVLLLQAEAQNEQATRDPATIRLKVWTMTGGRRRGSHLLSQLHQTHSPEYELVLLDAGDGPADMAASMSAAKKHLCDFVLINLDNLFYPTTDAAQLVAELSSELRMPALVNHRTTVSPDFIVYPSRRLIPDVAELQFLDEPQSHNALTNAIQNALNNKSSLLNEPAFSKELVDPETYFANVAKALRFHTLLACGETHLAARIPDDAIDAVRLQPNDVPSRPRTLYDSRGRRITGSNHGNGVWFDWAPPAEIALCRGGYMVLKKESATNEKQLAWSRGDAFEITIDASTVLQTSRIRLTSHSELPKSLQMTGTMPFSDLQLFDESDVPNAVKTAARQILNRPMVRSWWYLSAPRHGSNKYRPLFQKTTDGQLPAWDNSHLQYWTVLETGWVSDSGPMSDLGTSTTQRAWILVQAAATNQNAEFGAPSLVQRLSEPSNEPSNWTRVSHAERKTDPADPKSKSVWVDEYESRIQWHVNGEADMLWCALHLPDKPRDPVVRFLRIELPAKRKRPHNTSIACQWFWYYDNDVNAMELQHRIEAGEEPTSIIATTVVPDENSDDLITWRRYLLAIDQPSVRKQRLDRVASIAQRVLRLCEAELGGLPKPRSPYRVLEPAPHDPLNGQSPYAYPNDPEKKQLYAWAADAAYRRVRAIGYRELPDVLKVKPIEDQAAQDRDFDSALKQLCGIAPIEDWRFALALVRHERRQSKPNAAYEALRRYATQGPAMPWYFKKERDLWGDGGWEPQVRLGHARWFLRQANEPVTGFP